MLLDDHEGGGDGEGGLLFQVSGGRGRDFGEEGAGGLADV